jgi:hypothetical protein
VETHNQHRWQGVVIGVVGSVLLAGVLSIFTGIRRVILQDNQIDIDNQRITDLEKSDRATGEWMARFGAQHEMLITKVDQYHAEEMAMLTSEHIQNSLIRSEASTNSRAARDAVKAAADAVLKNRSSLEMPR